MVRSMYSGVSGMKAHQARMDVIGNNIANVNTYGFKASRASFRDIYYQTSTSASGGTSTRGGTNPSQIGYGSKIGSVDVLHSRSSFAMTDNGLDVAIAGEGFFQVQDSDGNTFYTRAGMLNIDQAGNLVDMSGNFVLGTSGSPLGKAPGAERIQISIPPVDPKQASTEEPINGMKFTITAGQNSKDGNVTFNFQSSADLPLGENAKAEITTSGITIHLNKDATFADITALNKAVNDAITTANGGVAHPSGNFTIDVQPASAFPAGGLTGADIASKDFNPKLGSVTIPPDSFGGIGFKEVGPQFLGEGTTGTWDMIFNEDASTPPDPTKDTFTIRFNDGVNTYEQTIPANATSTGSIKMTNTAAGSQPGDYIIVNHPGFAAIKNAKPAGTDYASITGQTAIKTELSKALGLGSKPMKLTGGTEGGPQTVADLSSVGIGADGVIEAIHPTLGRLQLGRIDVVTFENPQGLEQAGNTNFVATSNSGSAQYTVPGTDGSGALAAGSLEMSNVDLSREFSDMITTQRGFQANSRLITVSDEMLNELVNLKR